MAKRANEKAMAETQKAKILQAFKKQRIEKEFRQLTAGELLKPITKRLDMKEPKKAAVEAPDYGMDEFDSGDNPFDEDFRPDEETPPPSPSPPPPSPPPPPPLIDFDDGDDDEELIQPPPPLASATEAPQPQPAKGSSTCGQWGPPTDLAIRIN